MPYLIRGNLVHCPQLGCIEILKDYLLAVDDRGFIYHCCSASHPSSISLLHGIDKSQVRELPEGEFLLPTFVDLHLHAPQFLYQGTGLHLPLMKWLDEYAFKAEEKIDADPILARRVYQRLAQKLIENGTGAVLLFGTLKEESNLILADVMQKAGIRAFVGKLSMDTSTRPTYVESSTSKSLSALSSFVDKCYEITESHPLHRRLVEPVVTPRFVPTCTDELLSGLGAFSQGKGLRIQSHLAEAHDQVKWVKEERGIEDITVFDRHGLLTDRTVQAHCTYLSNPDLDLLSSKGTAIAHCPLSNAYFSAKPFPLREAIDNGVKVGLGTDIAGGYDIDIKSAMRQAVVVSRIREGARLESQGRNDTTNLSIDWKETLFMATRGGALALGVNNHTSLFEVGAAFDAQQIKLWDAETGQGIGQLDFFDIPSELEEMVIEKWWCLGDSRNQSAMWVQGTQIKRAT